jgi:hypothetical protein
VVFIESLPFTRRLHELAKTDAVEVLTAIQSDLLSNPERGRVVPGLGGIRKAGCRSPARQGEAWWSPYLYLYLQGRQHVHLFFLFGKNEGEDVTERERRALRKMADAVAKEGGRHA